MELNQSVSAIIMNSNAGMRWLDADSPSLYQARKALDRIVSEWKAGERCDCTGSLLAEKDQDREEVPRLNLLIQDIIALTSGDVRRNRGALRTALASGLPPILGDRVQLQ